MRSLLFSLLVFFGTGNLLSAQELAPYIKVSETEEPLKVVSEKVVNALEGGGFEVLGAYHPANRGELMVIAFTREDLKNTAVRVADRGALGAVIKVGLVQKDGKVITSYTNPDYLFRAYLREAFATYETSLDAFSSDVRKTLAPLGDDFTPFGGAVDADELKEYHYKITMPYFTDPITLAEYDSFREGLAVIEENLSRNKGNTLEVYRLVYPDQKIAVFGVALGSKDDGEAHFLPKIGVEHAAAMPYEIILQDNRATMLHGKYRIALHWPDLTMGTFMKIMSTPGDIEDTLEGICTPGSASSSR